MNTNDENILSQATPAFLTAMSECLRITERLGIGHPESKKAMMLSMSLAPEAMMVEIGAIAEEMGLIPGATGYLDDGSPVFALEAVAMKAGLTPQEADASIKEFMAATEEIGLPTVLINPSMIHRVH